MPTTRRPTRRPAPHRDAARAGRPSRPTASDPRGGHRAPHDTRRNPRPSRSRTTGRNGHPGNASAARRGVPHGTRRPPQRATRRIAPVAVVLALAILVVGIGGAWGLTHAGTPANSGDTPAPAPSATAPEAVPASDASALAAPAEPVSLTLTFAGDCTLGTEERFDPGAAFPAVYEKKGPDYFFANVRDILTADDLTVANCEGVLTTSKTREDKQYAYKGKPAYAGIFAQGGVDAVSVSNNHNRDYGPDSRSDTLDALAEAGVTTFGDDAIAYEDVKGVKVALIGAKMLSASLEEIRGQVVENIQAAQNEGAQVIVVFMHWGVMREYNPTDDQMALAHAAVDAGATIVVGSHQHVVQGYEKYHGRYIVYGLGNFCYGGSLTLRDPDCYLFQQTFTVGENGVETDDAVQVIPCLISSSTDHNNYQPTPAEGAAKERIEQKIADSTANIASRTE